MQNLGGEIKRFAVPVANLFRIIGYFSSFRASSDVVFKVKDMQKPRDTGARVGYGTPGKAKLAELLNVVQDKMVYSPENIAGISQLGMCVMLEIVMRHYTATGEKNKTMFLSSEKAFLNLSQYIN
jgi:hypothetical protein